MTNRRELAKKIALMTEDAYSHDRYAFGAWEACAFMLLGRGHTAEGVEAILRSKHMRWAGDACSKKYGHVTSADLRRYLDGPTSLHGKAAGRVDNEDEVEGLIAGTV